ncbi:MAG: GAF domain-containing protein [Phototrophicaceae bacterium]
MAVNNPTDTLLEQLRTIAALVIGAAEADNLPQTLQHIADASRQLIGARYAALGIPDGAGGMAHFIVSGISPEQVQGIDHPPIGRGLLGLIMNERRVIRMEDLHKHPKAAGFPNGHPSMTSLLGVPIVLGKQLYGMFYLTDRIDGNPFAEEDQWLIEALAGYAALAISSSQLHEQQHQITLLNERTRIGMELHDGVIQSLYAVGMHLDVARRTGSLENEVEPVMEKLNHVIEDIRRYIMQLNDKGRPTNIEKCVQHMIAGLAIPSELAVTVEAPDDYPLVSPPVFESVCLMINEMVSNVIRHAQATQLSIRVEQDRDLFSVQVSDNGKGFDYAALNGHRGLGLKNLERRAELYQGHLEMASVVGRGTTITITFPLQARR